MNAWRRKLVLRHTSRRAMILLGLVLGRRVHLLLGLMVLLMLHLSNRLMLLMLLFMMQLLLVLLMLLRLLRRQRLLTLLGSIGATELEQVQQIGCAIRVGSHIARVVIIDGRRRSRRQVIHGRKKGFRRRLLPAYCHETEQSSSED
jgi:hypothetical protein